MEKKRIAVLGSTGSIGTQALEVISRFPDLFEVEVLTAYNQYQLLIDQSLRFRPNTVVIGRDEHYAYVNEVLSAKGIKVYAGLESIDQVVQMDTIDLVLAALVGFAGLSSVIKAIEAGKIVALANKETLVVAGELVTKLSKQNNAAIIPVDSEHSAIFQCLVGEYSNPVEKIYLTASGGPFRGYTKEELEKVTVDQALAHPNWDMGAKITVDSASLMNKGLEAIEAKWLFDLKPDQIDVIVHPQSIIHSIVQFQDGSMKAQMGLPDMKLPIQYAFGFPKRLSSSDRRFDFIDYPELNFEKPDLEKFPNLRIAYDSMRTGGNAPCIMNAANEIAVEAFLEKKIGFSQMTGIIEKTLEKATFLAHGGYQEYVSSDRESREIARALV
jgi:1-deoxy-D-xylulose-5-phosphate reductoisomerase